MPRTIISLAWLKDVQPAEKQVIYWDTATPGFGVLVSSKTKAFIVQARLPSGKERRITLGRYPRLSLNQARDAAKKTLSNLQLGIDPIAEAKAALAAEKASASLGEVYRAFLAARPLKATTRKNYDRTFNRYLADWASRTWHSLTTIEIQARHRQLAETTGHPNADTTMRILRSVLTFAQSVYRDSNGKSLVTGLPTDCLKQGRLWGRVTRREGHLSPAQIKTWWRAVDSLQEPVTRDYLKFTLLTGLRRNEAACLTWQDIDLKKRIVVVKNTKNHRIHTLPLGSYVWGILETRRREKTHSPWIFPGTGATGHFTEPKRAYLTIEKRTGIKATIHDLRRTFASYAEASGASYLITARLLNHSPPGVTAGYVQVRLEDLRSAMDEIEFKILDDAGLVFRIPEDPENAPLNEHDWMKAPSSFSSADNLLNNQTVIDFKESVA